MASHGEKPTLAPASDSHSDSMGMYIFFIYVRGTIIKSDKPK